MKNIVLIGMPGSGKSTFGQELAKVLHYPFYDADKVLEIRENRTIKNFFEESETAFRKAETRTLTYLSTLYGVVIATGGGAVKNSVNIQLFKENSVIIFIDRLPEKILSSLTDNNRPLLAADKDRIFALYAERIGLYRKYADYIVENNDNYEEVLPKLLQCVKEALAK